MKQLEKHTFVGDKTATLVAIKTLFQERDRKEEHSYVPFNKTIPETTKGFVYFLISVNQGSAQIFYVCQTKRALLVRLSEHNCGNGSDFTKVYQRLQWAIAAFVCIFEFDCSRKDLEPELHSSKFERLTSLKPLKDMTALSGKS